MSLSTTTLSTTQGTASASGLGSTGSAKHHSLQQKQQEPSPGIRSGGSSTMITLAAGPDVVVAIGSTASSVAMTTTTTTMSPASTTKLATSGETHYVPTTTATKATAPRTAAATNPTSGIVTATSGRARTAGAATTTMTTRATTIRRRHKVKEFNDEISCSLCAGYLINATTIDHCGHSYCRSCIIRHWKNAKYSYCPQCGPSSKAISLSNLITDERLKSLVYKLVPGLYHNELQRLLQFTGNEAADEAVIDPDEDYFSPVEPISLSLEYHPEALVGCDKEQIPPVRYLQCPAAVTIHHLKRFISSKFDIDLENSRVGIEIIYEEKILPEDFSLMDIGYCYSWKRENPMKFFYRILIHSVCNSPNKVTTGDSVLSEKAEILEAKCVKQTNTVKEIEKDLRRSQNEKSKPTEVDKDEDDNDGDQDEEDGEDDDDYDDDDNESVIDEKYSRSKTTYTILKTRSVKGDQSESLSGCNNNNNNNSPTSKDKKSDKNQKDSNKGSVKMTIIARKSSDVKGKQSKAKSKRSASPQKTEVSPSSDFKSLRSNDVRYSNDYSASLSAPSSDKQHKSKTSPLNSSEKTATPKCDIFVSIPPQSGHRSSNSSDDSYENLSLAQLKTANKKATPTVTLKQSVSLDESMLSKSKATKLDVPKLKITVPKKPPSPKSRKFSVDEPTTVNQVDITTYAKNIGLKPINPPLEEKREIKLKISPNHSPSSSLSSSSTSSPPSAAESGFLFSPEITTSSHKKRKKAKHSKEPKEPGSKRRKLHAEISSQPAEESLKLKVKITGNPKSYKAERKANCNNVEIIVLSPAPSVNNTSATTTKPVATTSIIASPTTTTTQSKEKHSRVKHMVNIPNLNRTLSEASNNINNLMKDTPEVIVSQETTKPPPVSQPTISTPSMSTLKPLSIPILACGKQSTMPTTKLLSPKLPSLQDTKLPASPPLPPSLFKPTSMTLQPVSTIIPRAPLPVPSNTRFTNETAPAAVGHLNRMATTSRPANNFAVPNPPKILNQSARLTPISSIASAANRQAQLKRSASLDGSPPILAKQQKLEQERLIRKSPYAPSSTTISNSTVSTPPGNGIRIQKSVPPISPTTTATVVKVSEPTYYTSAMASAYTREIQPKKQKPISLPPSSISVTKMPDIMPGKMIQSTSGLSIIPQQHTSSIQQFPQQKPALEIVRISSNIPPIDQQKLTVTNNNTVKPTATKTTRPPPPTIPLVKIKRSVNQTSPIKPTVTTVCAPVQQQAALSTNNKTTDSSASVNGGINNNKSDQKSTDSAKEAASKMTTDNTGALDLSGKSSRSPSQDKNSPPQTPKLTNSNQTLDAQSLTASSLEEALNKLKQQMGQSPVSSVTTSVPATSSASTSTSSSTTIPKKSSELLLKDTTSLDSSISSPSLNSTNLQNLKMLSESATNRERIAIKNRTILPKLNEINKIRQNATVRQQNASVRNIPNPSALAFRSQQPIPKLASITKTPNSVVPKATSSTNSSTVTVSTESVQLSENSLDALAKLQTTIQPDSSTIPKIPSPTTTSTMITGASKIIPSKKNLHLEQLAASLNMRAAAAAVDSLSKSSSSTATSTHPTSTTAVASYAPVVATSSSAGISATTT